jgi:hypothetical protein
MIKAEVYNKLSALIFAAFNEFLVYLKLKNVSNMIYFLVALKIIISFTVLK